VDARLQRRVQRYGWDKSAIHYEEFWQLQLDPVQARIVELAHLQAGERVIDVACGTGLASFPIAALVGSAGTVLGVDLSEKMIEIARGGATERALDQVRFERMDAEDLQVADSSCDVAVCSLGLMYVPSPLKALQEMHRVLRSGGRAVVSVWGQRDRCGWAEIFPIVDARVASEVCPMFFRLGTGDILQRELEAASFARVTSERLETRLVYSSHEEACGAAFEGGPVALAYSRFEDGVKVQARNEYLASIESFRDGEGYSVPGEFVIGIGYKA
jgi:ubiquinone/menaquinone biosynthesis C-methylase UbiE